MKLVRCEWAPSLVVEWLCGELEERGIPGPTYAHTLLSLLHHHYCPHPAPTTPISASTCSPIGTGNYQHPLSRRHLDDFDLRDLDLDDLLGHTAHPDADLPDFATFSTQQRGGSRRARKRYKVRQKQRILTSEQLQKVAALQCLMSASDERYDLESLIEELCVRLKTAAENEHNVTNSTTPCNNKSIARKGGSQESINDTDDSASTSTPEEQAEKYYAAFPPLSKNCKENCIREKQWQPGKALCSCVWENQKPSFSSSRETLKLSSSKMPRSHRKKGREKEKKKEAEAKFDVPEGHEGSRRHHHVSFTWHAASKHRDSKLSESYDTDSASEHERSGERRRKKFLGPLLDEDIGEGYIGDTSSRESSEDRDKGEQDQEKGKGDKGDKNYGSSVQEKNRASQEEWECMGDLLMEPNQHGSGVPLTSGGGRLFERGSTSGGTSGSSSDVETYPYATVDQEAESVRQLERKISDTVAQVWGQASEHLGHGQGEHVWDPPSMEELTLYTAICGLGFPDPHGTQDLAAIEQIPCSETVHASLISNIEGWQQSQSWQALDLITQNDPLLCNISCQSPQESHKVDAGKDASALIHLTSSLEKSIWSDCNANNISGSEGTLSACIEDPHLSNILESRKSDSCHTTEELENKLCESFMKLGLENLWENTLGLEGVFEDPSVNNCNLEYISENKSGEGVRTDSEHEKMMALVEDVCKSYESQEESALDSSLLKQLPSGPTGPQADLHHTESSGFSMVVPRGKSTELGAPPDPLTESMLLGHSHAGHLGNMDTLPLGQDEENLLTSPRTHFRPIRQESIGSTADDHYEDGTMFIINSERPDLPFQRTSSGALFLESDLLEGSPKKYMVYKEPVPKVAPPDEEEELVSHNPYPAVALIPKFKVVNNEKFCQTETATATTNGRPSTISVKRASYETGGIIEGFGHSQDEEPDVFEFQHQDFPDNKNLAQIWKNEIQTSESSFPRNIWHINTDCDGGDGWPHLHELEGAGLSGSAWLSRGGEGGAVGWSSEGHFETPAEVMMNQRSEALASLWHCDSPSASPSFPASIPNLQALWTDANPHAIDNTDPDTGRSKMYIITNPTTHIPENCSVMSSLAEVSPWKPGSTCSMESSVKNRRDQLWAEKSLASHHRTLLQEVSFSKRSDDASSSNNIDIPGVCPELRLEVDQEADELLGAVHAQTSSNLSHCQTHLPSGRSLLPDHHSPRPLHERLKKCSSGNPVSKTTPSVIPDYKFKGEDLEREDLDDLAPGWELNDGFEWEPQTSGDPDDEECPDGLGDDDDGESGEVLLYETEDGTTYTIPVEYLDDTLYDQIFGATEPATQRLGGSLPDLPSGHPAAIRFSSELEDEWKKSGIPYKVQLPRKPRPGRWIPPSRRPCTFFMEGSCRRSDCKFSHDLSSITCRFWEEGSCLKGITCPFLHGYPLRRRRNKSEGAVHSEVDRAEHHSSSFEIDSEMDFPTLGSSCESKPGCADERIHLAPSIGSSCSSQHITRKKKRKFITITKNVLGEVKSAEAERAIRRRAALRRERRRRHTDTTTTNTELHTAAPNSDAPPPVQHNPNTLRKAERHRASASGHEDGTVSDY